MATCPYCLGTVPDQARKCQHCGEWVKEPDRAVDRPGRARSDQSLQGFFASDDLEETVNTGIKWYAKYWIATTVIGFVVFLFFLFAVFLPQWNKVNSDDPFPSSPPREPIFPSR